MAVRVKLSLSSYNLKNREHRKAVVGKSSRKDGRIEERSLAADDDSKPLDAVAGAGVDVCARKVAAVDVLRWA